MKIPQSLLTFAVLTLLAASATAQLDLPDDGDRSRHVPTRPVTGGGDIAPHLVCTVCGTRNYTATRTRPAPEDGYYFAVCAYCRENRRHREGGPGKGGNLDLPDSKRPPGSRQNPAQEESALPDVPLFLTALSAQARFILEEVAKNELPNEAFRRQALQSLLAMGADGVLAGRVALLDDRSVMIELGARVLLECGRGSEIERVAMRLRESLPRHLGPKLLDVLVAADPVHASPHFLCTLLEHSQGAMRQAATRHLKAHLGPDLLGPLAEVLRSKRTSTRIAVIGLVARVDDPAGLDLLLEHIADSSPTVCGKVLDHLGRRDDERLDVELLRLAFSDRWILRPSAYALLAVMDREDLGSRSILDERHGPSLLAGLDSHDPLVSGTCAAALAGIGFRSEDAESTQWIDDLVPAKLISAVSGAAFHTDYASLQPRAMRRLELITGERIGANGGKWVDWWTIHRGNFHALRAPFPIALNEVSRLIVRHRSHQGTFALAGFDAPAPTGPEERFVLSVTQMAALVVSLRELGVLSSERLPGVRGKRSAFERELSLHVLGREKVFLFGEGEEEEWFTVAEALLTEQREQQRWQRFTPSPTSDHGSWEAEALWWETEQDEMSRALRMKDLVLIHLQEMPPSQRQLGLAELERVLAMRGTGSAADFEPLLGLIEEEAFYTERSRRLITLARGLIRGDAEPARRARQRLLNILLGRFGDACAESVAALLSDVDPDQLLSMSADEHPLVRALIAVHFSGSEVPEERAVLLALLDDEDPSVEAAAVAALGHARLEGARTDLLVRARFSEGVVRLAALEASGRLGGEGVRQALVTGLAERDDDVQLAALKGLAHLKDPNSISLFVSYLQQAPNSPMFGISLRALESFGAAAHEDILRVASSTLHKSRRPAALLLARAGAGAVAKPMAVLLGLAPDPEVARELAILTCFDLRDADEPASEYLAWLRSEDDHDAWRWFVEATARREFVCPARGAFGGRGTREAALFLLEVTARCESFLAERARRELERMLGVELVELPVNHSARGPWIESARELVNRAYGGPGGGE